MKFAYLIKKVALAITTSVAAFGVLLISSCGLFNPGENGDNPAGPTVRPGGPHSSAEGIPDRTAKNEEKILNFSTGLNNGFWAADGWKNNGMFNCTWSAGNAVVKDGIMNMSVTAGGDGYYGAEYRTTQKYSYGYYSVCMKAAKCPGLVSSFFTYTNSPVWDEIDIEFLGKDTTKVQFNYYTNGVGGREFWFDLGFDASEGFHEYGFDWREGSIVWYVDGKAVYKATENIPSHPQQIMMNVWNGIGVDDWLDAFDPSKLPATAQYLWSGYGAD